MDHRELLDRHAETKNVFIYKAAKGRLAAERARVEANAARNELQALQESLSSRP